MKAGHSERAFDSEAFLLGPARDVETARPGAARLGGERRDQSGEKLIAHRNPFRAGDILLVEGLRGPLTQTKKSAAAPEPPDIDAFGLSANAPDESRVGRIIFRMN